MWKCSGRRFGDLLDEDSDDVVNTAAQRRYFAEQVESVMEQENEILEGDDEQ
ncbi:MAG: hypothetical protein PUH18_04905 [Coriobacteriaceae bacterium]|nr:hypothetical protein [Coriobacteriaceae bacterium]